MRLRLSKYVPADLEEIADYIAQDSPRNALRFIRILRQRMKKIAKQPELYQLRPEIGQDARLATQGNYVILFRILNNAVRVERVLHGSRDLFPISTEFGTNEFETTEFENWPCQNIGRAKRVLALH